MDDSKVNGVADGYVVAPEGKIWMCAACGKRARTRYGFDAEGKSTALDHGYDESCMLNAVLIDEHKQPVTAFQCPPGANCEHIWDGPELKLTSMCSRCDGEGTKDGVRCKYCDGKGEYESGSSSTCSKCGMSAIDYSLWNGP